MKPYSDTNFFTHTYLELPNFEQAKVLFEGCNRRNAVLLPVTWLHRLEFANSLERLVFESRKGGQHRVTPESAAAAHALFEENLSSGLYVREVVLPLMSVIESCHRLIRRRTAKYGFRTYDCIHVASALELGCDTFWSFDKKALQLAKLEGLKTN